MFLWFVSAMYTSVVVDGVKQSKTKKTPCQLHRQSNKRDRKRCNKDRHI